MIRPYKTYIWLFKTFENFTQPTNWKTDKRTSLDIGKDISKRFETKLFDKNELYKRCKSLAILPSVNRLVDKGIYWLSISGWTLQKLSIFGHFAVPKVLGMIKKGSMIEFLNSAKTAIFTFAQCSLIQRNFSKVINFFGIFAKSHNLFGKFAIPKGLGISKRLIGRSPKLLPNIYFYFYTIEFD